MLWKQLIVDQLDKQGDNKTTFDIIGQSKIIKIKIYLYYYVISYIMT